MDEQNGEKQSLFVRGLVSVCRVLLILGLLFYVMYHLTNGFSAEMRTEVVKLYTEPMTFNSAGVIVRRETVIKNTSGGVASYRYENGTRVNKDAKIATVYGSSNDAAVVAKAAQVDKTVDFLEELDYDKDLSVYDGIAATKEISALLTAFSDSASRGNYAAAMSNRDALLKAFIRRDAALDTGKAGVEDQLEALAAQRASLEKSLSGAANTVTASVSGYFYDYTDGGEGIFDYDSVKKLTPSEYKNLLSKLPAVGENAVGKIVTEPKWYFITEATKEDCLSFNKGKTYEVLFHASNTRIVMTLEAENIAGEEAVLVFSSFEMPLDFDFSREQKVSVVTKSISGYRVPSNALRVVDGVVGVYIRVGNTVKFRVADVIYESGAYSYISTETEGKTLYALDADVENDIYCKALSLYDNVIVSGSRKLTPDRIVN
ncbi:MAG: hypothetical protein E7598_07090 [Ruminococcaceae bacterium]|nr:hypothetical protein [Oscillospiraceae bacterium]